jgi:CHAD domain-containing protein
MLKKLDRLDLEKLQKRAIVAARKYAERAGSLRHGSAEQVAPARRRAARRAERLRSAMDNAATIYLPDRLHDVRIAVKKLRYSLELLREVGGSRGNRPPTASQSSVRGMARLRTLKRAQDLLGRMHDLEILIARTRGAQGSSSVRNLKLSAEMDRLVRHLETECRRLHGHYIALRPRLVAICDQTIAQYERLSARAA